MVATLIGIQTGCVVVMTYLAYRNTKRTIDLKLVKKDKVTGFKHFKTGRF